MIVLLIALLIMLLFVLLFVLSIVLLAVFDCFICCFIDCFTDRYWESLRVRLHKNEEENFFNRIVKSELNKIVQGRHRNSTRNSSFSSNS